MVNNICTKCFEPIENPAYVCEQENCTKANSPQMLAELTLNTNGQKECSACGAQIKLRKCSICGHTLGRESSTIPKLPIMIVGASGSGKSNYISVLIEQIRQSMGKVFDCALYPLGGDVTLQLYDRLYYHPVYVQGRLPTSTDIEDIEPLDYSLIFTSNAGKSCDISFYDSCGNTFESDKENMNNNRGLPHASGIILLIDPTQLTGIRDIFLVKNKPVLESDISAILTRIIQIIRRENPNLSGYQKIQTPIAICLSKLDKVQDVFDNASFVSQSSRQLKNSFVDKLDFNICNLEIQSFIESYAGKEIINQVRAQFTNSCFFAFSSLGSQPPDEHQINRLAPHRVLDPLLWLLWKNDILQSH